MKSSRTIHYLRCAGNETGGNFNDFKRQKEYFFKEDNCPVINIHSGTLFCESVKCEKC